MKCFYLRAEKNVAIGTLRHNWNFGLDFAQIVTMQFMVLFKISGRIYLEYNRNHRILW